MRKKFTMLLASLFLMTGVAKADFTLSYTKLTGYWGAAITEYPQDITTLITDNNITSAEVHCLNKEIDVVTNGDVKVTFTHVNGDHKQHLLGVALKGTDGNVVKFDYHYGTTPGATNNNNVYTLSAVETGKYTLSMYVTRNGNDQVNHYGGTITVTGADLASVVTVTTNTAEPVLYTIKNVRGNVYAQYNGVNNKMQLNSTVDTEAHLFYFTAGSTSGTYKIHNYVSDKKCAGVSSWTTDGVDWYIKPSGTGLAISTNANLGESNGIAWNDESNAHKYVAWYNGNDAGSVWAIERFTEEVSSLGLKMSTSSTKHLYFIRNDRSGKFVNCPQVGSAFAQVDNTSLGSYWYFVEAPGVENVPVGFKACYIYNAASNLPVQNHTNGYMSATDDATYPAKVYFVGAHESTYWGYVMYGQGGNTGWNDHAQSGIADYNYNTDGSIWDLRPAGKTEAQLKSEANTAKTNALNTIGVYEFVDYYTYSDEAIATAKTAIENINTTDLASTVSGHMSIEPALTTLRSTSKGTEGPKAGDYIRIKNKEGRGYMKNDLEGNYTDKILGTNDAAEIASNVTLWAVESAGDESTNVKLRNVATGRYLGELRNNSQAKVTDVNGGTTDNTGHNKFAWTNINDCYAVFKDVSGGDGAYAHMGNNNPKILIGYNTGDAASHWLVEQVTVMDALAELQALIDNTNKRFGTSVGLHPKTDALEGALETAKALIAGNPTNVEVILSGKKALQEVVNAAPTTTINTPATGKYYRLKNKSSENYMSGNDTKISLLANGADAVSTIFYLGEDKSLRSFVSGKYLDCSAKGYSNNAKSGEFGVAYNGNEANVITYKNNGHWTYGAAGDGGNLDRGSGTPDKIGYNWYIIEVDMTSVINELNALATDATAAASLEYLTAEEKTAFTTAATTMSAAATTLTNGGFVKDMTAEMEALDASIDAAMNVMTRFDLTTHPFRLKQTASELYMVATENAKIASKSEDVTNQAFNLESTGTADVYNLKSVGGLYMQADHTHARYIASAEDGSKDHSVEYKGRGKYYLKTSLGYVGSDNTVENSDLWSNKAKENENGVWEFELLPQVTFTYSYKYNDVVKRSEAALGYVGCPYPTPAMNSVYGVVPTPKAGNVSADDNGVTFDMEYTIDLPFQFADSYDEIEHWYFMKIRDDGFTYMGYDADKSYLRANQSSVPVDAKNAYTWAFVGNPFDGFSIVNYATGKGKVLSAPVAPTTEKDDAQLARMVEVTNEYAGNLVWNIKAPTHASPKPGVFYIEHPIATSYAFNRQSYEDADAVCYWNGRDTGSAIQVVGRGLFNLSDLKNEGLYILNAERSPLMYDANAATPGKLSSGLVSGIAVNAKDVNQQFIIFSSAAEGAYYLYSVGASKFVDADLNFTDYPEPVLSFEKNNVENKNNVVYPWFVKINGKYVGPSEYGTAGNKVFHQNNEVSDDEGKRYQIVKVDEDMSLSVSVALTIQHAEGLVKNASSLSNSKVYTVSTYDRGKWCAGDEALTHTMSADAEAAAQQFAFLTVGGKTYLYSVEKQKFVVKSGNYTAYSDVPTQPVVLLEAAGNKFFPVVVAFVDGDNLRQIGISHGYSPSVITFNNDLNDSGNKVDIRESGELASLADVVANMEAYLNAQTLVPALNALIAKAGNLLTFLPDGDKASAIASAKTAAEGVLAGSYNSDNLNAQIEALTAAINDATLVKEIDGFDNAYVYTFVSKRGWMGADATNGVISDTGADDNANYQWAVYKSTREHYYLYNIGKAQFMGVETRNNTQMPFSATPQTTGLTFKKSAWADYPIMFSMDNQYVVNNNNGGKMICWTGGWNKLDDEGSNHQVAIVGKVAEATLTTIVAAVELYETRGVAIEALAAAIAEAQAKVDAQRDVPGYYSSTNENAAEDLGAIIAFRNAIDSKTVDEIKAETEKAKAISASFKFNMPKADKFYVLKCNHENRYIYTKVDNKLYWSGYNLSGDYRAVWQFEAGDAEGKFKMKNVHNGSYIPSIGGAHVSMTDAGADVIIAPSPAVNGAVIFSTSEGGNGLHAHGGANTVIGYTNDAGANHYFFEEVTTFSYNVAVGDAGYSTLYLNYPVKVPAIEGANEENEYGVYVASEVASNYVALELVNEGDVLPAKTGVIIKAAEGDYTFTYSSEASSDVTSQFLGTTTKTLIQANSDYNYYVLANGTSGVGLYRASLNQNGGTAFYNNANKVYLPVSTGTGQFAPALAFRFGRGGNEGTTDLEKSEIINEKSEMIFDLTGRRIPAIVEKGIYIVNGKKVVIR